MFQASVRLYRNAYQGIPRPVWWLALVLLVNRAGTMVIPFLTVYLTGKGYTLGEAGLIMGIFGAGAILGGYLGGWLSDRFGFFYIQVFILFINGVLFIVLGYMQQLWQIGLCTFVLSSLGEAFRPANAAAIAAYSNDSNRTRCFSLNRLAVNLGWAIGPAVGGMLASIDYALLFWTDGLTCIAASFLLYFLFAGKVDGRFVKKEVTQHKEGTSAYKDHYYLKGLFFILLIALCFFQLFSIMPVFYKELVHLQEATIGLILSINGILIALIEMVLVYKLENRRHGLYYMVAGACLIGLSFLMLSVAPLLSVVLASMIMITFGEMLLFPFANNFWVERSREHNRGQYAALYTMTFALAQVLAPTMASQIALHWNFNGLFMIDLLLCAIAAVGFYFLRKQ
jgi:MFS family permease